MKKDQKKEKFILERKQEILKLEKKLKYYKLINLKLKTIKNLKISGRILKYILPYITSAVILCGVSKYTGFGLPFKVDEIKHIAHTTTEYDADMNKFTKYEYIGIDDVNPDMTNVITHYSKWEEQDNGLYFRRIKIYKIKELSEDEIEKILNNENINLEALFGEPIEIKKEETNNIELVNSQNKEFLKATIHGKNKNDYIFYKESKVGNFRIIILWLLLSFIGGCVSNCVVKKVTHNKYLLNFVDIESKYKDKLLDKNELVKILEIEKNNYKTLTK